MRESYWSEITRRQVGRRRALALSLAASAGAALLAACGRGKGSDSSGGDRNTLVTQPADTSKQAKRGGTIRDRTFADPPTLDIFTPSAPHNSAGPLAYNTLVQFKAGYLKPTENEVTGDLAESWETSPDGLQVTLKLRQGVKWHNKPPLNGRAFDIDDALFAWERFASKSSGRGGISNAADARAPVLSITAGDSKTLVMKLKEPLVYALGLFASNTAGNVIMVPKETDTTFDIRGDIIGTGPYVMSNYTPSVGFTFKRNPEYWSKDVALADQVDVPILAEYATALAQFKAGNIFSFGSSSNTPQVSAEDVLPLKRDEPRILVYKGDLASAGVSVSRLNFGWLPAAKSPFLDERVRQAVSMSWDRELFFDAFFNIPNFKAQGLPVDARWNTAFNSTFEGWWLDPKGADFGPNAKYFRHDPTEARRLLAAAGYPNGFETVSQYVTGPELGNVSKHAEVLDGMISEAGITRRVRGIDYLKEYAPLYRDGHGQFEGWAYVSPAGAPNGGSAIGALAGEYWSKGGTTFKGFSLSGQNDQSGDPQVDSLIEKARVEQDTEKRRALTFEIQRYLAKPMYSIPFPGLASGFTVAWPCLGNFRVFQGGRIDQFLWVDDTKPPFKSA